MGDRNTANFDGKKRHNFDFLIIVIDNCPSSIS